MKKLHIVLLVCLYALSISGVSVKAFYCCGKLSSLTLTYNGSTPKEKKNKKCCYTHILSLKVTQHQTPSEPTKLSAPDCQIPTAKLNLPTYQRIFQPTAPNTLYYPPSPPLLAVTRSVLFCVYRI